MNLNNLIAKVILSLALILSLGIPAVTAENSDPEKLVFVFQKQKDPAELKSAASLVGNYLSKKLNMPVEVKVPLDYSASVQALVSKQADIAYVSSLPFLLARRDGDAEILLAEQRIDPRGNARTEYDSIFVVKKDSPLKSLDDLVKNASNLSMAFTSSTSTSGYVFAVKGLIDAGLLKPKEDVSKKFKSVSFAGGYTQALEQVLADKADVAAVSYYTVEGPSATKYLSKEQVDNLRIIARTPGVPTHIIVTRSGLSDELKSKVKDAVLKLAKDKPELLTDVYGTSDFVEVDENEHVAATATAVKYLGLPIEALQ